MLGKISSKLSVEPTNENLTQQNVQFRATKPIPNDSVEISTNKKEKNGLSNVTKWAVGTGLTALAATGIYIATKKRLDVKKFAKMFEDDKKMLEALPVRENSFKGNTIQERIANILGKDSKVSPHSYDLSKEYPAIPVYRNQGGYKNGFVTPKGIVDYKPGTSEDYPRIIKCCIPNSTDARNRLISVPEEKRLVSRLELDDPRGYEGSGVKIIFTILSPDNKLTPVQKDLEKIKSNPKLMKEATELFDKALKFMNANDANGNIIFENVAKYEQLDYEVILSIIQSLAKKAV